MDKPNLIIFKFKILYEILNELEENINYNFIEASNEKNLENKQKNLNDCLIITQKRIEGFNSQFVIDKLPIKIFKLLEKVNVELIKFHFSKKSELSIGKYSLNFNTRELVVGTTRLKLTEKEVNIILFLFNSQKAISIDQLQSEVWGYNSQLETHTVETHIYRLRKKLLETFKDNNFIQSNKNGYQIS